MSDPALAKRIREILARRAPNDPFITYQALASALGLQPPGTIQRVDAALEQNMRDDVNAGRALASINEGMRLSVHAGFGKPPTKTSWQIGLLAYRKWRAKRGESPWTMVVMRIFRLHETPLPVFP